MKQIFFILIILLVALSTVVSCEPTGNEFANVHWGLVSGFGWMLLTPFVAGVILWLVLSETKNLVKSNSKIKSRLELTANIFKWISFWWILWIFVLVKRFKR